MTKDELKHFIEYVFPNLNATAVTVKIFRKNEPKWVLLKITAWKKWRPEFVDAEIKKADVDAIRKKLDTFLKLAPPKVSMSLADAAKAWGKGMSLSAVYKNAGIKGLAKPPTVKLGPSTSKGHYDSGKNIIWINPKKNKTDKEKMGTLYFELGNAYQKDKLNKVNEGEGDAEEKAWKVIKIEFKTSLMEFNRIMSSNKAKSVEDLVVNIGIPEKVMKKYCKKRTYSMTKRVPMPTKGELKKTNMRTALYWYQIIDWSKGNQILEFGYRPHTPGGKESTLQLEINKFTKKK